MSSIRILDEGSLPEVDIMGDIGGQTIDIGNIESLDIGLLANHKKLNSPPGRLQSVEEIRLRLESNPRSRQTTLSL